MEASPLLLHSIFGYSGLRRHSTVARPLAIWSYCESLLTALNRRIPFGPPCVSVGIDERLGCIPFTAFNALLSAASAPAATYKQVILRGE